MSQISKAWLFFFFSVSILSMITTGPGEAAYEWPIGKNCQLTLGGHLKSLNLIRRWPEENYRGFTDTQVRFDAAVSFPKSIRVAYSQVADLLVGEEAQIFSRRSPFDLINLDATPVDEESTVVRLHPDRLNLGWESEKFSAVIGRQAIGFGNLLGFSPLDLVAPFPPLALDKDIRPGVDAGKVEYYPGPFSTITAVVVIPEKSEMRSYLLLYTLVGKKGDFNLLLGENQKKPVLGFGYSQDVKGMGVRAESLFFGREKDGNNTGYTTAGLEVDYLFRNDLYVDLEFFYNGDGASEPEEYNLQDDQALFAGRYYAVLSSSYELTPLLKFSLSAMANLQDGSWLASPRFTYSISDNSEALAFIDLTFGRSPGKDDTIRSEYGSAPQGGGLFLRLFF